MGTPDVARLAAQLREQTGAFAEAIEGADPGARVPTCPDWRVRDLVGHIGQGHRWAAGIVRGGRPAAVPDPREAQPGAPQEWPGWLAAGAAELADAVRETGPEAEVWTFVGERPAVFWLRRMLYDTCVHRADAALVSGSAFTLPPDLAAGAICEGLELMATPGSELVKPALAELRGHGETLRLRPTEASMPGWLITRTPEGVAWDRTTADADVVVSAPVRDLLLMFARRLPADGRTLEVTGDSALLEHWLARTAL